MPIPFNPARTLRDVFNAVDPARPLQSGDSRYVDSTVVRGNEDVVTALYDTITWSESVTTQLFTGHRGCGKSTELLRLKERLENANYAVVYFEADHVIDLNNLAYTDLLIAITRQLHASLPEIGVKPNQALLDDVLAWFADVIYEKNDLDEVKAELAGEFKLSFPKLIAPFAQMMARVTGQIKTSAQWRKQVRQRLAPQITQLIANINLLLRDVDVKLRKKRKQGLVLLIDNLDRIPFRTLSDDGRRNSHDALYIENGEQLRDLHCHLIYSVPIAMFYSPHAPVLENIFPDNFIMPMIKTRDRSGQPYADGEAIMRTILERRIVLDEIFEKVALERLCKASGGHPRDLMTLVRYACRYAQPRYPKAIDVAAAERAIGRLVNGYGRMIPEEHVPLLAQVHLSKQIQNDNAHRLMLHNLSVLEYINGSPPWHDVHPAVLRLPKFQEALANVRPNRP